MTLLKGKPIWVYLGIVIIILIAGGLFTSFGPPKLYAKSETAEFCDVCHVMDTEYTAWRYQGSHRRTKCVDCHLPNGQIVGHLSQKGILGMWDFFYFYSGLVPENIRLSESGARILKANCERCHVETIARVNLTNRNCWECHRRLSHLRSGDLETLSP